MNHWEIILSIVLGLLVNEVFDISPWLARKLVQWSAYRWATDPEIAADYAEEWAAVINDRPGKLLKLLTALQFTLGAAGRAAPRAGLRAARAIRQRYQVLRNKPHAITTPTRGVDLNILDEQAKRDIDELAQALTERHAIKINPTLRDAVRALKAQRASKIDVVCIDDDAIHLITAKWHNLQEGRNRHDSTGQ